ncbi:hypothetical protein NDU88_006990 [Pleurodeles waltl]|uniref:Uncharacterized protein n=1 Tax=Pleurodeles waltl TaxID=8319 RepID=A0AAV7VP67_PLEWA|nr:hypothetical protein NDU88_006990 [Pleurodeles waltl]
MRAKTTIPQAALFSHRTLRKGSSPSGNHTLPDGRANFMPPLRQPEPCTTCFEVRSPAQSDGGVRRRGEASVEELLPGEHQCETDENTLWKGDCR